MSRARVVRVGLALFAMVVVVLAMSASGALAQPPLPNPVATSNLAVDVKGLNLDKVGPAASIHGNPAAGRTIFAQNCAACHGTRGIATLANPGSDDEVVPSLNPADPGFAGDTPGDPSVFADNLDLFIQHGSRPSGPDPAILMAGWGDQKLLTQQQIADVEAYIMQLNGVYWPDRWNPPTQVQMQASRDGNLITYRIMLANEGASDMVDVVLRDTLPSGLAYVASYVPAPGQNPGQWDGSTVEWITSVPQGGVQGPFYIVVLPQGSTVPANVAQVWFDWTALDGNQYPTTAVSEPVVPPSPAAARAPTAAAARPAAPTALPAQPTAATAPPGPTANPVPQATSAPTAAPSPTAAPAPTQSPTPAPVAGDAAAGAQLFASKGCSACHVVNGSGGIIGPDLTHIATQPYDSMRNDPAFLAQWIADPPAVKPGTTMPKLPLTADEINNLVAYLTTLK